MTTRPHGLLVAVVTAGSALMSAGEAGAIDRFEPVEKSFTVSYSGSAYRNVNCMAIFNGLTPANGMTPTSANRPFPLFWDGGSNWKLRVAGRLAGTYQFSVGCTGGTPSPRTGSFVVGPAISETWTGGRGFVSTDGHFFRQDSGNAWLWFGDTAWLLPWSSSWFWQNTSTVFGMNMTELDRWASDRANKKFTVIQTNLSTPYIAGQKLSGAGGADKCPFGCATGALTNVDIDPSYYRNLDERIQLLVRKGFVVALGADFDGRNLLDSFPGAAPAARNRYIRYIVARYAAYNLIWFGLQEHQEEARGAAANKGYVWDFFSAWKSLDPYRHPLTTHSVHRKNTWGTVQNPDDPEYGYWNRQQTGRSSGILALLDFIAGQEPGEGPRVDGFNVDTASDDQHGYQDAREGRGLLNGTKGYVEAEFGYERVAGIDPPSGYNDQVAKDLREDIWGHMTGGAAGFTYGDRAVWKFADLSRLDDPGARQVTILIDYFASIEADARVRSYTDYASGPGWTRGCSTGPAFRCTTFLQTATELAPDTVAAGPRVAPGTPIYFRWYNATTGTWRRSDNSASTSSACESRISGYGASAPRWTRPSDEDATWVLLVKSANLCPS